MAQTLDMPAAAFETLARQHDFIHKQLIGDRVVATEVFTGQRSRDLHDAMDSSLREAEAAGGKLVHRTRIGRNASCPCGSGLKFKKCCIDRAVITGNR
jgi:hypothetical protein